MKIILSTYKKWNSLFHRQFKSEISRQVKWRKTNNIKKNISRRQRNRRKIFSCSSVDSKHPRSNLENIIALLARFISTKIISKEVFHLRQNNLIIHSLSCLKRKLFFLDVFFSFLYLRLWKEFQEEGIQF
jgi:hypothetical protein